jgi:hypothetical protein
MSAFDPKQTWEAAICCDAKRSSRIYFLTCGRTRLLGFLSSPRAKGGNLSGTAAFHSCPTVGARDGFYATCDRSLCVCAQITMLPLPGLFSASINGGDNAHFR